MLNPIPNRAWASISQSALIHNISVLATSYAAKSFDSIMAVVKADAYGHGIEYIGPWSYAAGLRSFGVASIGEAAALRSLIPADSDIYLLSPALHDEAPTIVELEIIPLVSDLSLAHALSKAALQQGTAVRCHIEIDTGIGRAGLPLPRLAEDLPAMLALPGLNMCGISTHFASADDEPSDAAVQLAIFRSLVSSIGAKAAGWLLHAANSPGVLAVPGAAELTMIRPGLLLYGIEPMPEAFAVSGHEWKPVLSLYAKICLCRSLRSGDTISYGRTFVVPKHGGRYATIPVGYGDGYLRQLSSIGYVLIKGRKAPICGRVCMDQFVVDVTDIPEAETGAVATLVGIDPESDVILPAEELASLVGTTPHEITTCLTGRVKRVAGA